MAAPSLVPLFSLPSDPMGQYPRDLPVDVRCSTGQTVRVFTHPRMKLGDFALQLLGTIPEYNKVAAVKVENMTSFRCKLVVAGKPLTLDDFEKQIKDFPSIKDVTLETRSGLFTPAVQAVLGDNFAKCTQAIDKAVKLLDGIMKGKIFPRDVTPELKRTRDELGDVIMVLMERIIPTFPTIDAEQIADKKRLEELLETLQFHSGLMNAYRMMAVSTPIVKSADERKGSAAAPAAPAAPAPAAPAPLPVAVATPVSAPIPNPVVVAPVMPAAPVAPVAPAPAAPSPFDILREQIIAAPAVHDLTEAEAAVEGLRLLEEHAVHEILPHLFLGGNYNPQVVHSKYSNLPLANPMPYSLIINATSRAPGFALPDGAERFTFTVMPGTRDIDVDSFKANGQAELAHAIRSMHRSISAGRNVFVNCRQGVDRSATIVIAYIMSYYRVTVDQALNFVRNIRYIANPLDENGSNYITFLRTQFRPVDLSGEVVGSVAAAAPVARAGAAAPAAPVAATAAAVVVPPALPSLAEVMRQLEILEKELTLDPKDRRSDDVISAEMDRLNAVLTTIIQ